MYKKNKVNSSILRDIFFVIFIIFLSSCVPGLDNKSSLTDEKVEIYINVYKKLRENTPEILQNINESDNGTESGMLGFTEFEKIITDGGLEGYSEFIRLNAKIGTVFSIIQANKGMDTFEKLSTESIQMFDDNIKSLEEQLNDPEIPNETKNDIKETIKQLKEGKVELNNSFSKNEKIAKLVLENVQKLSKLIVSEEDVKIVLKHENEIMEAYVGFPIPKYE